MCQKALTGGSLRFEVGGHQDSAPRHMNGHVLNKYSYVESPGLKTAGQIHVTGGQFVLCRALIEPPDL